MPLNVNVTGTMLSQRRKARKEPLVLLGNCSCVNLPTYIRVGVSVLCASARKSQYDIYPEQRTLLRE